MAEVNNSNLEFEVAVSALLEYGFPKPLIKRTLKDILKVYAGNEAWPLIKENGYEVVIERLISNDGPQQRKSKRRAYHELENEKKKCNLDPDTGNAGVVPRSNKRSSSSLLARPSFEMEDIDVNSHQKNSWTRNELFPLPAWFRLSNMSKNDVQQKFSDLHVLLEQIDKDHFKQGGQLVNDCSFHSPETMAVKDGNFDFIEKMTHINNVKGLRRNEEADDRSDVFNERAVSTFTFKISNGDMSTSFPQKQESRSTLLKTPISADDVHRIHAETSLPQSSPEMPKTKRLGDVLHSQHDVSPSSLDATGVKQFQRENSFGSDGTKRKRERSNKLQGTLSATERLDIARMSACKLTRRRDGGPNPMFSRLQKLKQAGAGAIARTHQQENIDLNASEGNAPAEDLNAGETRSRESPELPPGFWEPSSESHELPLKGETRSTESPKLPPGFWEPSSESHEVPLKGTCEIAPPDPVSSADSPKLPPGFWEPCDSSQDPTLPGRYHQDSTPSDESPLLPPGFSEPYEADTLQVSPKLPPGFCEPPAGMNAERLSPDLPPGFWESSGDHKVCRPTTRSPVTKSPKNPLRTSQEDNRCFKDYTKGKGTPPKQVFIANIPEGLEGSEQKLYNLVTEVLQGFKSVPLSATLPCKIQVRKDHAFVEFCCEAMAGIFVDAYLANVSAFRINGEQLLAARNMQLMKRDIQLRLAVASRLKGQVINPRNVFYLGNVPLEWQNEERLFYHIASLLKEDVSSTLISKTLSVFTIPNFSDVYVHILSSLLAETFFLRCLNDMDHMEEISTSLFVCRNSTCLPRASRVVLCSDYQP